MIMPPCKVDGVDCEMRHLGCHSKCKRMEEYRADLENMHQAQRKDTMLGMYQKDAAARLKKSNGCIPSKILREKLRRQERGINSYGKVKKNKSAGGSAGK